MCVLFVCVSCVCPVVLQFVVCHLFQFGLL